jgi:type I restriction enzyme, S subunit
VKPGYKQTVVGAIPDDWIETTVGSLIAEGVIGKPLDGNHGDIHPKSGDFVDWGIPFVMANNVQDGRVDLVNCSFLKKEQADSLQKGFAKTGDVLLTHKATIGNTAIVEEMPFPYIMLTPQVTYYRVVDKSRLSNVYLRYYFDSAGFQSVLRTLAGGGTRAYIGISAQHQLPIVLPPTQAEQSAIGDALSDVEALLSGLDRLIAKKRDIKQAAMRRLLKGEARLPGFHGEWTLKRLGDVAEIVMGQSPDSRYYNRVGTGVPLIQGNADIENRRSIARVWTTRVTKAGRRGELLLTVRAPVGSVARVSEDCCLGRGVCSLRPKGNSDFLFHALVFAEVAWKVLEQGSTFTAANSTHVASFSLSLPSCRDEQRAIADLLTDMDAELAGLEQRREKTRSLKQAIMQVLLTGKTRLVSRKEAHGRTPPF